MRTETTDITRTKWIGRILATCVALVWMYHGLVNKLIAGGNPRHLAIVQAVPGFSGQVGEYLLLIVGVGEILLAIWMLCGCFGRTCAIIQTIALLAMNILELTFAREHLLWPRGLIPVNLIFLAIVWTSVLLRADRPIPFAHLLKRHPFAVVAHFRDCLVLTYAMEADAVKHLLPPGLELDTYHGKAIAAVAIVQAESLRPAGWPRWLGQDFVLVGYRLFVRFNSPTGRTMRGLRILRSDTDQPAMMLAGNALTHYQYHLCKARVHRTKQAMGIRIHTPDRAGDLNIVADLRDAPLHATSEFTSEHGARRFAGPLPWTFDYETQTHSIVAIKGTRAHWRPRIVNVKAHSKWIEQFAHAHPTLASAFHVRDIDYRWERGVRFSLAQRRPS